MTNKEWVDFLSKEFSVSKTSARDMLHAMMTNQKAAEILGQYDVSDLHFYTTDGEEIPFAEWSDAIEMAISALQAQEALQPTCNNLATDTISRQAIINSFRYDDDGTAWDMDDIVYRLEQFPSAQPEQRWIPCSERLPEPRIDVWVNSDIGQIQGYYEEHTGIWYASLGQGRDYLELIVNAWMPLPEPYRAERRTDD